jgi:iron(III) transport system ATP-binding protein
VFVTHDQWEAMTLATSIAVMHEGSLQQVGSPNDIYETPAKRFVAEFVGSPPINIAEIGAGRNGRLSALAEGYLAGRMATASTVGSIGLRPEQIKLSNAGPDHADDRFEGAASVVAVLPTGGSWIIELDVEGASLFMTSNRSPEHAVGDSVHFQIERSAMHVFDQQGERLPWED